MKKISEVSKLVGVSKRTLQYYDDEGLLVLLKKPTAVLILDMLTFGFYQMVITYLKE